MFILINHDLCSQIYAVCFSDDKSKLEEEIKRITEIKEKFKKDVENRKILLEQYLNEQLNKNLEKLMAKHNSIFKTKNDFYNPSFEDSWEEFVCLIKNSLNKKDFRYYNFFQGIIKFPEHLRELKEPKEYIKSGLKEDLYIVEAKTI